MTEQAFVKTNFLSPAKVLVLSPHPDDETFGCGGSLLLHRAAGDEVKVLFLTDGASCFENIEFKNEFSSSDQVRILREEEAIRALSILGITDHEFFRYPDKGLQTSKEIVDRLSVIFNSFEPTLVYLPHHLDPHRDHRASNSLFWKALRFNSSIEHALLYEIHQPMIANMFVDITSVAKRKEEAISAYTSQLKIHSYKTAMTGLTQYRAMKCSPNTEYVEAYFHYDLR